MEDLPDEFSPDPNQPDLTFGVGKEGFTVAELSPDLNLTRYLVQGPLSPKLRTLHCYSQLYRIILDLGGYLFSASLPLPDLDQSQVSQELHIVCYILDISLS